MSSFCCDSVQLYFLQRYQVAHTFNRNRILFTMPVHKDWCLLFKFGIDLTRQWTVNYLNELLLKWRSHFVTDDFLTNSLTFTFNGFCFCWWFKWNSYTFVSIFKVILQKNRCCIGLYSKTCDEMWKSFIENALYILRFRISS